MKPATQSKTPSANRKKENKWIKPVCITAVVLAIVIAAAVILPNVLGGLVGLALSLGAVQIYNLFSATAVAMDWTIGMIAIGFCAVIGVLFGGYPAAKASRLQPIDALHTT